MSKITCIILNYNDADTVLNLVKELKSLKLVDTILVADNCSSDDSWRRLGSLKGQEGICLLRTKSNGGYGRGNQAAIVYALKHLQQDYILVANPDIHITDSAIETIRRAVDETPGCALGSGMVQSPKGEQLFSSIFLLPWWKELLDAEPVCRRIFRPLLERPLEKLPQGGVPDSRIVDAVPGSFFMLRLDRFTPEQLTRLFDPQVFLYCEEKILGQKMKGWGLKTVLATDAGYIHAHSVSIDKSVKSIADKQRLLHKSRLYYYKKYLGLGPCRMCLARAWLGAVMAEVWFLSRVCRLRW